MPPLSLRIARGQDHVMRSARNTFFLLKQLLYATAMVIALLSICPHRLESAAFSPVRSIPFSPGERLRFQLKWAVIPAGEAVLEVLPMEIIDGETLYHFRLTARSNAFVDLFFKVRDQIDAYVDTNMTHAVKYRHQQLEGDHQKDVTIHFDWQNARAHYNDGKSRKTTDIRQGTFDPLSVFYFTRMSPLKTERIIASPVSDGKKCVLGQARVVRRETIRVAGETYETFLIEPDLKHVGGVFEKKKDAKIRLWITADVMRIPVKIASKVAIGRFVGELVEITRGRS
jgi:hypothetical protein